MSKEMRKVRTGQVVRNGMDRTAVVEMVWKQRHRIYRKQMRRVTRFYVHDPLNQCQVGDTVRIQETRPISKTKHWRLLEILQRRQVADVQPIELETDLDAEIASEAGDESPAAEAGNAAGDDSDNAVGEEEDSEE
jgi:small subunit ribosomal protein S17